MDTQPSLNTTRLNDIYKACKDCSVTQYFIDGYVPEKIMLSLGNVKTFNEMDYVEAYTSNAFLDCYICV